MKWLNNLENISIAGNPGQCPFCNSRDTDMNFEKVKEDWGYGDIWCNHCHRAFHISRVKINSQLPQGKDIPKNLNY